MSPEVSEDKVNRSLQTLYNKNNLFGFFLLKYINEELNIFEDDEAIVSQLLVFEDNEKQRDFALQFKTSIPDIKKNIRKTITARNRALKKAQKLAEKPVKEKKVRAKKVSDKPKKEKKTKKVSTDDALIDELVSLANDCHISEPGQKKQAAIEAAQNVACALSPVVKDKEHTTPILEEPKKKTKKSKKEEVPVEVVPEVVEEPKKKSKKSKKEEVPVEVVPEVVEEPKKKTKKSKKEEVPAEEVEEPKKKTKKSKKEEVPTEDVEESKKKTKKSKKEEPEGTKVELAKPVVDDDEELAVSVFEFQNKQYLIDDDSVVYDFVTHDEIGKFVNGAIVPI